MLQIPCRGNHHPGGGVMPLAVGFQIIPRETLNALPPADNGHSKGMVLEEPAIEVVVNELFGIVLDVFQLLEDHLLLLLHLAHVENRILNQLRNHIDGLRQMVVKDPGVETGVLFCRECVEVTADPLEAAGDLLGRIAFCPLKDHVFEEVRDAVVFGMFVARAHLNPDPHGDRTHVGNLFRHDADAVGKNGFLVIGMLKRLRDGEYAGGGSVHSRESEKTVSKIYHFSSQQSNTAAAARSALRKLFHDHSCESSSRIFVTTISIATAFCPPRGMITSAQRLLGSTNSSCIGLTVSTYCFITDSMLRPRSTRSLRSRRKSRSSASVSTNILISIRSRRSRSVKMRIPSTMMTLLGSTGVVSFILFDVENS